MDSMKDPAKDPLTDRLTAWMRTTADQNSEGSDLTANALRIARRKRLQRLTVVCVAGVAAVAVALPFGVRQWLPGGGENSYAGWVRNSTTPSATTAPGNQETPAKKPSHRPGTAAGVDIDKLPKGASPSIAWYADGVIHDGDRSIQFEGPWSSDPANSTVDTITPVKGGFVVGTVLGSADEGEAAWKVYLVRRDSSPKELPKKPGITLSPVVSPDGTRVAYGSIDEDLDGGHLYLADTTTGRLAKEQPMAMAGGLTSPHGFLDDTRVLLERDTNAASTPVRVWDTATGSVEDWYRGYGVPGVSPAKRYVAVGADRDSNCFATLRLPEKAELWRSCAFNANDVWFSPDDRLVATSDVDYEGEGNGEGNGPTRQAVPPEGTDEVKAATRLQVLASATGKAVLTIQDQSPMVVGWENRDSILFVSDKGEGRDTRSAVVRCTVSTGECERATPVVPSGDTYEAFALSTPR